MPPRRDPRFERRLALVSGRPAPEATAALRALAAEAEEGPGFALMATLCRTLSDRNRLRIAAVLKRQEPLSAAELQAALGLAQPTVSHHLKVLVESALVHAERTGKWTYYRLEPAFARLIP